MSSEEDNNAEKEVSFDDELTVITTDVNNLTDFNEDHERSAPTGDNKGQDGHDGKGKRKAPDVEILKDSSENFIPPRKRFKVVSQSDGYKWVLPNSMAEYVNENMRTYFPDVDLFDNILMEYPVPNNIKGAQKLDGFLNPLLSIGEEKLDLSLEKIQQKTINVLGPLTKVWDCLDRANNCSEEEVCINLPDITEDLEKAILLLGQASHTIAYQRRLYILSAISKDARKAKQQLKEKAEMISQEDTYLFGKEFQTYISDTAKSQLKSNEIRQVLTDEKQRPFRSGPSSNKQINNGEGRKVAFVRSSSSSTQKFSSRNRYSGKRKGLYTILQHGARYSSRGGIFPSSSCGKTTVFQKNSQGEFSRKAKVFSTRMGNTYPGPNYNRNYKGLQYTLPTYSNTTLPSTSAEN